MQIESIRIKGIGPFMDEVLVPASELDEIVAVVGNNGAGKTFFLECIPGALYGYFPFRMYKQAGISIYDMVTPGIDGFIEMVFTIGGRRYRIERNIEIRGTWKSNTFNETGKNQNVVIQEDVDGEWVSRAEKAKAVNEYVEREICPQQLFLASSFNSQNSAGDIVDCGADERKQIFANIIGLSELQRKAELFMARTRFIDGLINQQETLKASEQGRIVDEEMLKSEIETAKGDIERSAGERESLESARMVLLEQKAKFDSIETELQNCKKSMDDLSQSLSAKKNDAEKLRKMILAKTGIQRDIDSLRELKESLLAREADLESLNAKLTGVKELDDRLAEIKLEVQKALTAIQSERARADSDLSTMKRRLDKARVEFQSAQARSDEAAILDTLNCEKNCTFVSRAVEARKWIEENPVSAFEETVKKEEAKVVQARNKLMEIEKRIADKEYEKAFTLQVKEIQEKRRAFDVIIQEQSNVATDIKTIKSKIRMLEDNRVEQKMAQIEMAEKQLPGLDGEISKIAINIAETHERYNKLSLDSIDNPNERLRIIQGQLSAIENGVAKANKIITEKELKLKDNKSSRMKVAIHEAMILKYQTLRGNYERLKEAFGRSGIQALVIDSEKLQFLDIARELFGILSGGKMALYFQTQKTLKSGNVREDFDLNLTVDGVTRRLEQCSQGQQDLGRIVMRATLGIYHSVKSGSRIQTYFLDETTGSLDEVNRENYYEFLKYLLNYFKQIFVISHQDVARIIPCRIQISNEHKVMV